MCWYACSPRQVQDSRYRGGGGVRGRCCCCIKNEFSVRSITKSGHHKKSQRRRKIDCHPFPADILSSARPVLRTSHILGGFIIESVHRGVSTAFMKLPTQRRARHKENRETKAKARFIHSHTHTTTTTHTHNHNHSHTQPLSLTHTHTHTHARARARSLTFVFCFYRM